MLPDFGVAAGNRPGVRCGAGLDCHGHAVAPDDRFNLIVRAVCLQGVRRL
jgi:hypothetical protein